MLKKHLWILAVVALLGFVNCVLVEPAFACNEDAADCSMPECHCCLTCNSAAHQWVAPQSFEGLDIPDLINGINVSSAEIPVDPPLGSIFHPPTPF
jgi:hypothetical protein